MLGRQVRKDLFSFLEIQNDKRSNAHCNSGLAAMETLQMGGVFESVSDRDVVLELLRQATVLRMGPSELLLKQGDPNSALYVVLEGQLDSWRSYAGQPKENIPAPSQQANSMWANMTYSVTAGTRAMRAAVMVLPNDDMSRYVAAVRGCCECYDGTGSWRRH